MPKRITLFYAWGSINAGDHALTLGAISLLRAASPDSLITIVTRFSADEPEHEAISKKLLQFDDRLKVCPGPFTGNKTSSWGRLKRNLGGAIMAGLTIVAAPFCRFLYRNQEAFKVLADSDWALQNGGNLYYWNSDRKSPSRLLAFALPLKLAKSQRVKTGFLPQTTGRLDGIIGGKFADFMASTDFVMLRDSDSKANLTAATKKRNQMMTVADLAFHLPVQDGSKAATDFELPENFVAVTLRDEPLAEYGVPDYEKDRRETRKRIMSLYPPAFAKIQKQTGCEFRIVIQVERDAEISRKLCDHLNEIGVKTEIVECYDPLVLMAIYANANILIAQRLHSQIFALTNNTPSIGLWRPRLGTKIPSMMSDIGCQDYCLNFEEAGSEEIADCALKLIVDRGNVINSLGKIITEKKQQSIDYLRKQFGEDA